MSQIPQAVLVDDAETLAAGESAHDQAQAQMQSEMHEEQGSSQALQAAAHLASLNLESPPQDSHSLSHAQKPSDDLGAASPLPQSHPPHDVVDSQRQAAACVTSCAQDSTAIPMSLKQGDLPNQSQQTVLPYLQAHFWWLR